MKQIVDATLPWNSEDLARWRQQVPGNYCFSGTPETNVMAVVGEGTGFEQGKRFRHSDLPNALVLIVEVQGTGVHWVEPVDLNVTDLASILSGKESRISLGTSGDVFLVGFLDGEVWMLTHSPEGCSPQVLLTGRSSPLQSRGVVIRVRTKSSP